MEVTDSNAATAGCGFDCGGTCLRCHASAEPPEWTWPSPAAAPRPPPGCAMVLPKLALATRPRGCRAPRPTHSRNLRQPADQRILCPGCFLGSRPPLVPEVRLGCQSPRFGPRDWVALPLPPPKWCCRNRPGVFGFPSSAAAAWAVRVVEAVQRALEIAGRVTALLLARRRQR